MAEETKPQDGTTPVNPTPTDGAGKIDLDLQLVNELNSIDAKVPAVTPAAPTQNSPVAPSKNPAAPTAVDPFDRLNKKKVARPQSMQTMGGQVKKGSKVSPKVFLIGCGVFFLIFL